MLAFVIGVLFTLVISLIIADVDRCLPAMAKWLVRKRADSLPLELRDRMLEEWTAELAASDSHLAKLTFAAFLFVRRREFRRACDEHLAKQEKLTQSQNHAQAVTMRVGKYDSMIYRAEQLARLSYFDRNHLKDVWAAPESIVEVQEQIVAPLLPPNPSTKVD